MSYAFKNRINPQFLNINFKRLLLLKQFKVNWNQMLLIYHAISKSKYAYDISNKTQNNFQNELMQRCLFSHTHHYPLLITYFLKRISLAKVMKYFSHLFYLENITITFLCK